MKKFYSLFFSLLLSLPVFTQNWDWVRHVTGTNNIAAEVVAADNNDNIILGGLRRGTIEFAGSTGPVTLTSATGYNSPFIAKFSSDGTLLWANELEGAAAGNIKAITSDNDGNIYAVGSFSGSNFVFYSQDGENDTLTSGGGFDPYLAKYDPDGNLLWAKQFASSTGTVRTSAIILDQNDNIILAGFFVAGTLDFGGGTSFAFNGASNNGYTAKFDNDGTLIWAKHFPGAWARLESGLALCQNEGFFATITIQTSVTIEGFGTINSTNGAGYEQIFVKFNNNGEAQWIRHATSTSDSYGGNFITSDEDGNAYFTGRFRSGITFPNPSGDPIALSSSGGTWDSFIARYDKNGVLLSAAKWGSGGEEFNFGIAYHDDIISTTGYFTGTMILNPGPTADTLVSHGNRDAYLVSFDKNLNYLSASFVGGTANDEGWAITFDTEGSAIFGGYFLSPTIDFGPTQLTNGGTNQDLFLAKIIDIRIVPAPTPVSCFGGSDGSITFSISGGGTPPYSYTVHRETELIASGTYSVPVNVTGLVPGTYKITATDTNLKSKVKYVVITQPAQLNATVNVINITTCYGAAEGQISITGATGGYGTYEYSINGGTNWQSSGTFTNISAGTYHVMIRDAAFPACERTLNETTIITEPTEIIIMPMPTNISCSGLSDGKIEISASGGSGSYTYSINGGETYYPTNIFTDLTAGAYTIYVNDGNCQKFGGVVSIVDPDPIVAGSVVKEDITCFGEDNGSITVSGVTGGSGFYEYSIDGFNYGESASFTGLSPNDYDVFIKDSYGCVVQVATLSIVEPNPIIIEGVVAEHITACFGDLSGTITITATGGTGTLSYSINNGLDWQEGSGAFTGLAAGTYNIRVKDVNNCETVWTSNPVEITQPAEIVISDVEEETISCFGEADGKITVTASGGTGAMEYSINGTDWQAAGVFENLAKNTYQVSVRDENGCIVTWGFDVEITEPQALVINNVSSTKETSTGAANGTLTIQVSGGTAPYSYTLTPGNITNQTGQFTGLLDNITYKILITDQNGCTRESDNLILNIDPVINEQVIKIYPNPSSGQFIVEFDNSGNRELFIRIYNVVGQVVYTHRVDPADSFVKKEINLQNEARGVYMLQITGTDTRITRKLIIR